MFDTLNQMTVGCVLIPRFSLLAAIGDRREMLTGPAALAPEPGAEQAIGEVSGAAEAFGIRPGMNLSEALGRCPALALIPPDPARAESEWELTLRRLEAIGAAVESSRAGEAFFEIDGLCSLWGPRRENVLLRAAAVAGRSARAGGGAGRFCAYAATVSSRPRRRDRRPGVTIVPPEGQRDFLSPLPIELLAGGSPEMARLVATLQRLGITTLGALAGLPAAAVADRLGRLGLEARELASGHDRPLRPRIPHEELEQSLGLPESAYTHQLERALEMLIERLIADPRRRGRTIRSLRIEARLAGGGSWRVESTLRSASASAERLRMALVPKLGGLPAPASALTLRAIALGEPGDGEQGSLGGEPAEQRRRLIDEAVRQARAAAGRDAVLRVLDVDPDSRLPERRMTLVPRSG